MSSLNGSPRFFAPAIVSDISASGLALLMDMPPSGHSRLHVRNTYFHAEMYIRSIVRLQSGVRVGCEFVHRLENR